MMLKRTKIYYGWYVVAGCGLVVFGVLGMQFSFGVFLKPMTEDFGWSRATLSLAFGITFMLSGLLRPVAGHLADRYSPKWAALLGVVILGIMLLVLPFVNNLFQLYIVFSIMSIGLTLGTGPILIKVVSAWFLTRRGLTLGLVSGAGSVGAMILVLGASVFVVLLDWKDAYIFLGLLLLAVILPIGILLIRNRPQDMGLLPQGTPGDTQGKSGGPTDETMSLFGKDATFRQAFRTPLFQKLTFGYFV